MNIITLTTDFGTADWFVGSMKGVILGINPQVSIVDITHEVPAGDIRAGAFALLASYRCFPRRQFIARSLIPASAVNARRLSSARPTTFSSGLTTACSRLR